MLWHWKDSKLIAPLIKYSLANQSAKTLKGVPPFLLETRLINSQANLAMPAPLVAACASSCESGSLAPEGKGETLENITAMEKVRHGSLFRGTLRH